MKKLLKIVCMFLLITALSACAQNPSKDTTKEDQPKTESTEDAKQDIPTKTYGEVKKETVFVSPEWVKQVLDGKVEGYENALIFEVAWGEPKDSPYAERGYLPKSKHINTDSVESGPLWNLRSPEEIEKSLLSLGIDKDTPVILYGPDASGTARVAYAYLWAGVENVKIMDGGLDGWEKYGFESVKDLEEPTPVTDFKTKVPAHPEYLMSIEQVKDKLQNDDNFKLVSIRSYQEFNGETSGYSYIDKAGEPKGAVWGKAGSDPFNMEDYLNDDGTYITMDQMKELWKDLDFNDQNELSFYCGTGWRASIPFLIMYENGYTNMTMYDGGWNQWITEDDNPVQVGDPSKPDSQVTTVKELPNDKAAK